MKLRDIVHLLKETFANWRDDNAVQLGAALAYYSVFSLAPTLVIAIKAASLIYGESAARGHISAELADKVGSQFAEAIEKLLVNTTQASSGALATIASAGLLLFTAAAVFGQLQQALNTVWGVTAESRRGWLATVKDRLWSFMAVLGVGFLLLVSLVVSTAVSALSGVLNAGTLAGAPYLWSAGEWLISLGLVALLSAMIFKMLPDVEIAWRDVWVGAGVTALLFSMGKHLIGLYLAHSSSVSAYGAAGSLVVVLLWVFYSSQIFLLGAEFTQVYANWRNPPPREPPPADAARARTTELPPKRPRYGSTRPKRARTVE